MLKNMTGHGVSGMLALLAAVATMGCGDDESTGPLTGLQPEVLAVSPDTGNVGTLVAISGTNFEQGAGVAFDAIAGGTAQFVDGSTLLVHAPDGLVTDALYDITGRSFRCCKS
jgi:hypothetical protein